MGRAILCCSNLDQPYGPKAIQPRFYFDVRQLKRFLFWQLAVEPERWGPNEPCALCRFFGRPDLIIEYTALAVNDKYSPDLHQTSCDARKMKK